MKVNTQRKPSCMTEAKTRLSEICFTIKLAVVLDAYANRIQDVEHMLVEMYHKSTHCESKVRILSEFKTE